MSVLDEPKTIDHRDAEILRQRVEAFDAVASVREGDYVLFADGELRRVSHVWDWGDGDELNSVQTSKGGSWYLGNGHASFSGSLYPGVKPETLTLTDEVRDGSCWFFHHDYHTAHNGIDVTIPFRVYKCSVEAPR